MMSCFVTIKFSLQGLCMYCLLWHWTSVLLFNSEYTVRNIDIFFLFMMCFCSVNTCNYYAEAF